MKRASFLFQSLRLPSRFRRWRYRYRVGDSWPSSPGRWLSGWLVAGRLILESLCIWTFAKFSPSRALREMAFPISANALTLQQINPLHYTSSFSSFGRSPTRPTDQDSWCLGYLWVSFSYSYFCFKLVFKPSVIVACSVFLTAEDLEGTQRGILTWLIDVWRWAACKLVLHISLPLTSYPTTDTFPDLSCGTRMGRWQGEIKGRCKQLCGQTLYISATEGYTTSQPQTLSNLTCISCSDLIDYPLRTASVASTSFLEWYFFCCCRDFSKFDLKVSNLKFRANMNKSKGGDLEIFRESSRSVSGDSSPELAGTL